MLSGPTHCPRVTTDFKRRLRTGEHLSSRLARFGKRFHIENLWGSCGLQETILFAMDCFPKSSREKGANSKTRHHLSSSKVRPYDSQISYEKSRRFPECTPPSLLFLQGKIDGSFVNLGL